MGNSEWMKFVLDKYHFASIDDMYASIGFGGISATKILAR
jgi:(p)ppGpp synthase/HD superfamily hydrolase